MDYNKLYQQTGFYSAKIASISYIYVLHFLLGFSFAILLEKASGSFNQEKANGQLTVVILFHTLAQMMLVGVCVYILRNIGMIFPNPLEGVFGLEKNRIKEWVSGSLLSFTILFFYDNLKQRMLYLVNRLK